MNSAEQQFLNDLDSKLWKAADKLRASLDAANYKHIVLGLIFLKYVSDAFYDALANNESALRELTDETLKKIAVELTDKLRKSTTVDWQKRETVRAKIRIIIRNILRTHKYPPHKSDEAIDLVLKQAEVLSNSWTV